MLPTTANQHPTHQHLTLAAGPSRADNTCCICRDPIDKLAPSIVHLNSNGICGNACHSECYNSWISTFDSLLTGPTDAVCPYCRGELPTWPVFGPEPSPELTARQELEVYLSLRRVLAQEPTADFYRQFEAFARELLDEITWNAMFIDPPPGEISEHLEVMIPNHRGVIMNTGYHSALRQMQQRMDSIRPPLVSSSHHTLATIRAFNFRSHQATVWRRGLATRPEVLQPVVYPNISFQRYAAYRRAFLASRDSLDPYLAHMGLDAQQLRSFWQEFDESEQLLGHELNHITYNTSRITLPYENPPREQLYMRSYDWRSHVAWFLRAWAGLSENIVLQVYLSHESRYHMSRTLTRELLTVCYGFTEQQASNPHQALRERFLAWTASTPDWTRAENLQARVGSPQDTSILRHIHEMANTDVQRVFDRYHVPVYREDLLDNEGHTAPMEPGFSFGQARFLIATLPVAEPHLSAWTEFVMICLERDEFFYDPDITRIICAVITYAHAVHAAEPALALGILGNRHVRELVGRPEAQYMMGWLGWPEAVVMNAVDILQAYTRTRWPSVPDPQAAARAAGLVTLGRSLSC